MQSTMSVLNPVTPATAYDTFLRDFGKPTSLKLPTVLLVDDDDMLRAVMEACLVLAGYDVVACNDAASALLAFEASQVDILLTDLQMPGRSGVELACELTKISPALPVVINSASLLTDPVLSEIQHRGWTFVAKPYGLTILLAAMESSISREQQAA